MASFEELHRAWQQISENRIRCAQQEGKFDNLPGFGRPLEEFMDINDPHGWARRAIRDSLRPQVADSIPPPSLSVAERTSSR
ncbi:MAG: DUF1992 domain-containing protein [Pirellulaceae bacterium]|nr:DUF1992 domain-containing protein [Pirellulaceae bacterium]